MSRGRASAALALVALAIGLDPQPVIDLTDRIAGQLLDPAPYIGAVLKGQP